MTTATPATPAPTAATALRADERDDTRKRPVWKPLAAAGIGGAVLIATGFGVFASLQATANNTTAQQISSGVLSLTLADNGAGFTQVVDKLAPNDVVNRFVTLTNNGTLAGKDLGLKLATTGSTSLITDGTAPSTTKALTVSIDSCATAWTVTGGTGTCATAPTTVLTSRPLSGLTTAPVVLTDSTDIAAGGQRHLRITLTLPEQTETIANGATPAPNTPGTIQNQTAELTWTFNQTQRTGTTTTS